MENNNAKQPSKVAPLISLFVFIVMTFYASFAYYNATVTVTNSVVNINLNTPAKSYFKSETGTNVAISVPADFFTTSNLNIFYNTGVYNNTAYTAIANFNVNVYGLVNCTYKFNINWVSTAYTPSPGYTSNNFEFSVQAKKNGSIVLAEKQISDYTAISGSTYGGTSSVRTDNWNFYFRIYDRPYEQSGIWGKNLICNIKINNVACS